MTAEEKKAERLKRVNEIYAKGDDSRVAAATGQPRANVTCWRTGQRPLAGKSNLFFLEFMKIGKERAKIGIAAEELEAEYDEIVKQQKLQ